MKELCLKTVFAELNVKGMLFFANFNKQTFMAITVCTVYYVHICKACTSKRQKHVGMIRHTKLHYRTNKQEEKVLVMSRIVK